MNLGPTASAPTSGSALPKSSMSGRLASAPPSAGNGPASPSNGSGLPVENGPQTGYFSVFVAHAVASTMDFTSAFLGAWHSAAGRWTRPPDTVHALWFWTTRVSPATGSPSPVVVATATLRPAAEPAYGTVQSASGASFTLAAKQAPTSKQPPPAPLSSPPPKISAGT